MRLFLTAVLTFILTVFLNSCASTPKVAVPPGLNIASSSPGEPKVVTPTLPPLQIAEATKTSPALIARPVTSSGDNRDPKFSPDGGKLLFLSALRASHRQAQVYELDLIRSTERRVTFHDGDDEGLSWASNMWFAYSSTTDELKEGAYAVERLKNIANGKAPPDDPSIGGEIYMQRLDGREINRMTLSSGIDISPAVDPSSNATRLVFVSSRAGGSKIFLLDKKGVKQITTGDDAHPEFRADGKALVWERLDQGGRKSQIFISEDMKSAVALTSPGYRDQQPSWHPKNDSIIFSSNRGGGAFDLFVFDRKAKCMKRLTSLENDALYPSFSPDGTKIAFVVREGRGSSQIYVMDDRSASMPCQ